MNSELIKNALLTRCPKCGEGRVIKGYLAKADSCSVCGESFADLSADDGPAFFVAFFIGLLTVPLLIYLAIFSSYSIWVDSFIVFAFVTISSLLLLPPTKGVFIAILWYLRERD
ncbi:MAG: DUF983 domain-containing protein [Alphaproteobacteria bacterium]|nr:DUF983 domain-containing protein [Alphaproteobacteria bacterium]